MLRGSVLDFTSGRALPLLIAGALTLTACGGGGDDAPQEPGASTTSEQAEATPQEGTETPEEGTEAPEDEEGTETTADADEPTAATSEGAASDSAVDDTAAAEGAEACVVDAATVSSVFAPVFGAEVEFLDSRTDERGGVSCSYETIASSPTVNLGIGASPWDGSQGEVEELVSAVSDVAGEPTARPDDLGEAAALFNEDGGELHHLAVFAGDTVYRVGMTGDLDGSAEDRREVLVALYEAAAS